MKAKKLFAIGLTLLLSLGTTVTAFATVGPEVNTWGGFPTQKRESYDYGYTCAVQRILNNYNTTTRALVASGGGMDGSFGSKTEDAVELFQAGEGISVDGHWGPNTWRTGYRCLDYLGADAERDFYWYERYLDEFIDSIIIRQGYTTGNWGARPEDVDQYDSWIVFRTGWG